MPKIDRAKTAYTDHAACPKESRRSLPREKQKPADAVGLTPFGGNIAHRRWTRKSGAPIEE